MKLYKVKVNGKIYEVEVESVTEQKNQTIEKKESSSNDQKVKVLAPMQGTILTLNVVVGSEIKKGQVLLVLESMKLENDIVSPVDGYISQVLVSQNQKVDINQVLIVIG